MWCEALYIKTIKKSHHNIYSSVCHFSALVNRENEEWQENGGGRELHAEVIEH